MRTRAGHTRRRDDRGVVGGPGAATRAFSADFFYNLGARLNVDPLKAPNGGPLDRWAYALGIGRRTGIGLPGEGAGLLPTPAWRQRRPPTWARRSRTPRAR